MADNVAERSTDLTAHLNACCAASYGHPLTRWLVGDSLHPGGLALTSRTATLLGIGPSSRVLDAGSGLGATAVHLARTVGCHVTGITLEHAGPENGYERARRHGVEHRVTFFQGSLPEIDLEPLSFDYVLLECVLSIIREKGAALSSIDRLLKPAGRLGLTDVTVEGVLPPEMHGVLALIGCIGGALSLHQYSDLLEDGGFVVERTEDRGAEATSFLRDIKGKLLMARAVSRLGKLPLDDGLLDEGERLLRMAEEQVKMGALGYGLIVGRKPQ